MRFSRRFYRAAAVCSAISAATTLMLIFLPRVYGPLRDFDARAAVLSLQVLPGGGGTGPGSELELVLRHQEPAVRPDDVLSGLRSVGGLELVGVPLLTRDAQGPLDPDTGEIGDPLRP